MSIDWNRVGLACGVAALVSAVYAFVPVYSLHLALLAIVLAVVAAFAGDRIFAAATPLVAGLNLYFLSPVFWPTLSSLQIAEQTVFVSGICLALISPWVAIYLHATDMKGANLVTGIFGIAGVCAFLGILLLWTKAIPLIVVSSAVALLLLYDFVLTLIYGESGEQEVSRAPPAIAQMIAGVYVCAAATLLSYEPALAAVASGAGRYIVLAGGILVGVGLFLSGLWNLIQKPDRPAVSQRD